LTKKRDGATLWPAKNRAQNDRNRRRPDRILARLHRQSVALAATLATRLRLTPSSKLDKSQPTDGELPVA
jgi:hypothetical protein